MGKVFLTLSLLLSYGLVGQHVHASDFSYSGREGPEHWAEHFNGCSGKYQSPININFMEVVSKPFWPIDINHFDKVPLNGSELHNNGHTVVVQLKYVEPPTISEGPLEGKGVYRYTQLHFHWGENNTVGSEDRINNIVFPGELHVVFYNTKYSSFDEAVTKSDGVAVMAFFFMIQKADNPNYAEFAELLQYIVEPEKSVAFVHSPTLKQLIVKDLNNYFTYTGSLTTPPCSEDVTWIDFVTPIMISAKQLERFRLLHTYAGKALTDNFRPLQPLNNRTIYKPISLPDFVESPSSSRYDASSGGNESNAANLFNHGSATILQLLAYSSAYFIALQLWNSQ